MLVDNSQKSNASSADNSADDLKPLITLTTPTEVFDGLLDRGLWPVSIHPSSAEDMKKSKSRKNPIGKGWGLERGTVQKRRVTIAKHPGAGVGVCLGPERGPDGSWLIDIEGDGARAEESLSNLFGAEVLETLGWASTRGSHRLFRLDEERLEAILPGLAQYESKEPNGKGVYHLPDYPDLEIRVGGYKPDGTVKQIQSVCPPTVGDDGKPRAWNGCETIASVPDAFYVALEQAAGGRKAQATGVRQGDAPTRESNPFRKTAGSSRVAAYCRGALEKALGRVMTAAPNTRHTTLRDETASLAGWLHYGAEVIGFDEHELYEKMLVAARGAEPDRHDHETEIRSHIAFGKKLPLNLKPELHEEATDAHRLNGDTHKADESRPEAPPGENGQPRYTSTKWGDPIPASQLKATAAAEQWIVPGYLARDSITLFSALWKVGKTTFNAHKIRAIQDGADFCGRPVRQGDVLYVAEESQTKWAKRRDDLGLKDTNKYFISPFMGKPSMRDWVEFINHLAEVLKYHPADWICFDTISNLWPVKDENSAGEVSEALAPLSRIRDGRAIELVHHLGKSDSGEFKASRGSGALPAFVDIIVEMRRHNPNDPGDRGRVLSAIGRHDDIPPELVVELTADGFIARGSRDEAGRAEIIARIQAALPLVPPGLMEAEVARKAWPDGEQKRRQDFYNVLKEGVAAGLWNCSGTGRKGDPFRYWVRCENVEIF
jgi:hypothetical protein